MTQPNTTPSSQPQTSAYDRVARAADMGEIPLKEAVLLKAKLLFAPDLILKESEFAPRPGEPRVQEDCGTSFFIEVQTIYPQLSEEEKHLLRSLSPDLEAIISRREEGSRIQPKGVAK